MSSFGQTKYEKKPKCIGGCKETESFVAKSGDTFQKCTKCLNLVHQRLKCGHKNTENATSQSEANNGRVYVKCNDCRQFIRWLDADPSGASSSAGSATATQSFAYAEKAEMEKLIAAVSVLAERVAKCEAKLEAKLEAAEVPGAKRARVAASTQEGKE